MNYLRHPLIALWKLYFKSGYYRKLVDTDLRKAMDQRNYQQFGRSLNLDNPQTLNEKIQWLELNTDTTLWSEYADKYKVRHHIEELGFGEYLPKLYGVWGKVEDIDFDLLPEKFVLKCNHDSLSTVFVDKNTMDVNKINKKIGRCLKKVFGYYTCEPHYLRIKPLVIAEEWLENSHKDISSSIIDYKIWCFNGKPSYIWVVSNRTKHCLYVDLFDTDWNCHQELCNFIDHDRNGKGMVPRPKSLKMMLEIAEQLAKGFPQVRIDFYDVKDKPYFGEMTFTSSCGRIGYFTDECQLLMGKMINLPQL